MSTHEIVLLGANLGGVLMAHYLLKHTIPQLTQMDKGHKYHLTIVSPNDSYYWKIAGPRALIDAKQIPIDTVMRSIPDALQQYPADQWTFTPGKAVAVDAASRAVTVALNAGGQATVAYSSLIVATGTHYESALWTAEYGDEATASAFRRLHADLPRAKTAIIAGGGPVGVETAGEIAQNYPGLDLTLYSGTKRVLERGTKEAVGAEAERQLRALGVKVVHGKRIASAAPVSPDGAEGPVTVNFDDGSSAVVDVYVDAVARRPNTGFLPAAWLAQGGALQTDPQTFRVTAADARGVYGFGDVQVNSNKQFKAAGDSVRPLASALAIDIVQGLSADEKAAAKEQQSGGFFAWFFGLFGLGGGSSAKGFGYELKPFKTIEGVQIVPIGAGGGTGQLFGLRTPAWFVSVVKGKTFLVSMIEPNAGGKEMEKA